MFANKEQGRVFLDQTDFEVAEQLRQEYMGRHHISDRVGGVGEYLAEAFEIEVVDEGVFALDGLQAIRLSTLARQSQSYHFGRYKKYSDDHEKMTTVSGKAINEPGIAKFLSDCVERMDAEAFESSKARNVADNVEGVIADLGISLETTHTIKL